MHFTSIRTADVTDERCRKIAEGVYGDFIVQTRKLSKDFGDYLPNQK